jgi:hypothetical protein
MTGDAGNRQEQKGTTTILTGKRTTGGTTETTRKTKKKTRAEMNKKCRCNAIKGFVVLKTDLNIEKGYG